MRTLKYLALPALLGCLSLGVSMSSAKADEFYKINCIFPYWTGFAPTFLAGDLGYFEDEGLEVSIVFDDDRGNVLPAMMRGTSTAPSERSASTSRDHARPRRPGLQSAPSTCLSGRTP